MKEGWVGPVTELIREWVLHHAEVEIMGSIDEIGMFAKIPDIMEALKSAITVWPDGRRIINLVDSYLDVGAVHPCGILVVKHLKEQFHYSVIWLADLEMLELEWNEIGLRCQNYYLDNGIPKEQ